MTRIRQLRLPLVLGLGSAVITIVQPSMGTPLGGFIVGFASGVVAQAIESRRSRRRP
jgi:hypothetical protein